MSKQSSVNSNNPVYLIKPKYIFKSPFLKYDLQNPTNREAQNEQLTEYFNYGFNEDTMNIYAKLVNRTLKVLDHKKNLQYFDQPSQLMRLNDEIPMDFGGFCKFYNKEIFKNDFIQNDQELFKVFLFNTFKATYINGKEYPMLQYVKSMYPKPIKQQQNQQQDNPLPSMIEQISDNLSKKYQETMKKLNQHVNPIKQFKQIHNKKTGKFQKKFKGKNQQKLQIVQEKIKKQHKRRQSSSSSSSSSSRSSSSSSSDSEQRRRKSRKQHKRELSRRVRQKQRSHSKKDRKQKDQHHRSQRHQKKDSRPKDSRNNESRVSKKQSFHRQDQRKSKKKQQRRSRSRDSYRRKHR